MTFPLAVQNPVQPQPKFIRGGSGCWIIFRRRVHIGNSKHHRKNVTCQPDDLYGRD